MKQFRPPLVLYKLSFTLYRRNAKDDLHFVYNRLHFIINKRFSLYCIISKLGTKYDEKTTKLLHIGKNP